MSIENVKTNDNHSSGEYVTVKKSTVKTFIVIAAAVVVGGFGVWFVNSFGFLSFRIPGGELALLNFIATYAIYAAMAVAAVLAPSAVLFRFVKFSYKIFVPVSAAASLLIGARVVYDYLTTMLPLEFQIPEYVDSVGTAILFLSPIGLAVAACVFVLSLPFGRVVKKLAKN